MTAYNVIGSASMVGGEPEDISVVLANFDAIANVLNGGLDDANIKAAAGILASKLANFPNDAAKVLKGDGTWGGTPGADLVYEGDYVPATTYQDGDVVVSGGIAYLCVGGPTTVAPDPVPWGAGMGGLVTYATTLPASPADGQEAILVDSLTAPTYQWRFRYNAGSTSPYKWGFVGGAPFLTSAAASVAVANTGGMTDAADSLPAFIVPRAGDYFIAASAALSPTATGYFYMGVHNASVGGAPFAQQRTYSAAGYWVQVSLQAVGTIVGAGQTIRLRFQAPTAGNVSDRSMSILPVRVA